MYGQSVSYPVQDPNVNRLLEETISSVDDVERRLQGLKIGIAQAFPHLAPVLQIKEMQTRDQIANVLARINPQGFGTGTPFGANVGQFSGLGQTQGMGMHSPNLMGQPPFQGTGPFSQGSPMTPWTGAQNPYQGYGNPPYGSPLGVSPGFPWGSFRPW